MQHATPTQSRTRAGIEDGALGDAIRRALSVLEGSQAETGAWPGDYGGPQFLLPLYVGTCHGLGIPLDDDTRAGMLRYIVGHQNPDGGWGLHIEGHSMVFTSSLNYAAARLLGLSADDDVATRAREWLREHGGPLASASWGKYFLALLNLYDYSGVNPVLPEMWLLPRSLPVHPARLWCHARMVYLPLGYLYAKRVCCAADATIVALREELYGEPYAEIDWAAARERVAQTDSYTPISPLMRTANDFMVQYEKRPSMALRARALAHVVEQMRHEDRNTAYLDIGPVSKLLHVWAWHDHAPDGPEYAQHVDVLPAYLGYEASGVTMKGYNSSEFWDTAFAVQAIIQSGAVDASRMMLEAASAFIEDNQMQADIPNRTGCYRAETAGSFPFSDRTQGWSVSDCTAEGMEAAMQLEGIVPSPLSEARLTQAAKFLLGMQNADGGWASYEKARGGAWLELLNPSDCFGHIMIDYSYVECTAACVCALTAYRRRYPGVLGKPIQKALAGAERFLLAQQRADGSFEGSWGVCFTYGTWFGIRGLRALGLGASHPAMQRAADFLRSKQRADGSWSETAESNRLRRYVPAPHGEPVQTSWALLGLLAASQEGDPCVERGIAWLLAHQSADGQFAQQHITGMFNKTCGIHYDNYPKVFPLWALGSYRALRGDEGV